MRSRRHSTGKLGVAGTGARLNRSQPAASSPAEANAKVRKRRTRKPAKPHGAPASEQGHQRYGHPLYEPGQSHDRHGH